MTAESERLLRAAGWTPGRRKRVRAWHAARRLERAGFVVWPELRDLLANLEGLTVRWENHSHTDQLRFKACVAVKAAKFEIACDPGPAIGSRWAPIGMIFQDHMQVLVAEDGRFFGTWFPDLWLLGETFDAFIDDVLRDQSEQEPFWTAPDVD